MRQRKTNLSKNVWRQIKEMLSRGLSLAKISKELNLNQKELNAYCIDKGWTKR